MNYTHLLLTRFNVRESEEDRLALNEEWLEQRIRLFEMYCLPSIKGQTDKNFKWVLLLDGGTPERFKALESRYAQEVGCELHFEYLASWYDCINHAPVLSKYIDAGSDFLVTSRIDSDDALACNYISDVKKQLKPVEKPEFFSFTNGAQHFEQEGVTYSVRHKLNHFVTLIEPLSGSGSEEFYSVLRYNHTELSKHHRVNYIKTTEPMWLEVVHGNNLINGYTPKYKYSQFKADANALFGISIEKLPAPEAKKCLRKKRREYMAALFERYKLTLSNYIFGTSATAANAIISLLIYPYVIRMLGIEQYGVYAFALVIANTIIQIESVPFNLPFSRDASAAKSLEERSEIFSSVMTAKLLLIVASTLLFVPVIMLIPNTEPYRVPLFIIYASILGNPFMPNWYYQAIQKTKIIAYIQISVRLASIPFIILLVTEPQHLTRYAIIYTSCTLLCALVSFIYLKAGERLKIRIVSVSKSVQSIRRCLPTFMDCVSESLTKQLAGILTGSIFGMTEMTFYDLASKITQIIGYGTAGVNTALMPHVIRTGASAKKIMKREGALCIFILLVTILIGKPVVELLGGSGVEPAYVLTIILTIALTADFMSDGIISLVLVPAQRFKEIPYSRYASLALFALCIPVASQMPYTFVVMAVAAASLLRLIFTACQVTMQGRGNNTFKE